MNGSPPEPSWKAVDVAKQIFLSVSDNVPFFVALAVATGLLSLAPTNLLSLAKDWRWLFAGLSLFAIIYLSIYRWVRYYDWRQAVWQLKHIGADEREILKEYLLEDKSCGYFAMRHGPVATLIGKGILFYASGMIWISSNAVGIQPYVMKYLRKHPELVGVKKEEIGSKELKYSLARADADVGID
jgi:hypothetical protein